uniref:Ovule protein n=1 Tax=Heterorhabditis bacteriophora TaxID=37862 RepID=A0A1I7X6J6_HETBA
MARNHKDNHVRRSQSKRCELETSNFFSVVRQLIPTSSTLSVLNSPSNTRLWQNALSKRSHVEASGIFTFHNVLNM